MTESSQMDTVETLFFSAKLKIEWANIHIGYLNTLLRNISADETYRMGIEHDPKTGKYRLKVEGAQNIPADFPLLTGDIIHHLRCALDHTATAIVGMESTTIYFPFHERKEKFVALIGIRGGEAHHATRAATSSPRRALPRHRALCTNSKKAR